jgi:carboxyl-terminal processing protease
MRYPKILIFFLLTSLLLSCSGGGGGGDNRFDPECTIEKQNQYVHELLLDVYYWYREVDPVINYADFDSPQQTLDFLKYEALDRFSYIADAAEFNSIFEAGQYLGFGFSLLTESDGTVWIRFIFDDSSAGRAGLQRGDQILSINGQTVVEISDAFAWNNVLGSDEEEGYTISMLVRKQDGTTVTTSMEKSIVNINTVLHSSVINTGSESVGYMVYESFISTSNAEFERVFNTFNTAGVTKLILDLRYNGGGSGDVATNLASYLKPVSTNDTEELVTLIYNDKYQFINETLYLSPMINSLNLDQLIIITSEQTCSASEMIISGLDPYLDVKTVGSTTCGKPVGMNGFEYCGNIILPVTFSVENVNDVGEYFDGLPVDCPADDDVSFDFGDSLDPMLSQALYLSQNNTCQITTASTLSQSLKLNASPTKEPYSLRSVIGGAY